MKRIGTNSDAIARYDPAILVGFDGKRFYNEALGYAGMARNTANLPYSLSFYVWDNSLVDPLFMEGLEADEILIQADTLEELAHKMPDIDEEQFLKTVEQWNGYVEAGEDPDFGRPVEGLTKIEQPPFHAVILQPQPYITLGGVKTDVDSRVIRADGTPIPGLYAAGQVTGCYAEMEGLMYLGGVGQAMAFGMQAGKLAAQEARFWGASPRGSHFLAFQAGRGARCFSSRSRSPRCFSSMPRGPGRRRARLRGGATGS